MCTADYRRTKLNTRRIKMKLYDSGVFLVNGTEIVSDEAAVQQKTGRAVSKKEAAKLLR